MTLLGLVGFAAAAPEITALSSDKARGATQNEVVTYTVVLKRGDPEALHYAWVLSDIVPGVTRRLEGDGLNSVKANYVLPARAASGVASVEVTVTDAEGGQATKTLRQRINRGTAALRFLEPSPDKPLALPSTGKARFVFQVLNDKGDPVSQEKVLDVSASFAGRPVAVAWDGNGYAGELQAGEASEGLHYLEVSARVQGKIGSFPVRGVHPVVVGAPPLELDAQALLGTRFFLGVPLPDAVVDVRFRGAHAAGVALEGELVRGEERVPVAIGEEEEGYRIRFNYTPKLQDLETGLELVLRGSDARGRSLDEARLPLALSKENPAFDLRVLSPPPRKRVFGPGQDIPLEAVVTSDGAVVEDANLAYTIVETGEHGVLTYDAQTKRYAARLRFEAGAGERVLTLRVTAQSTGEPPYQDAEEIQVAFKEPLALKILYPPPSPPETEKGNVLEVEIAYPNGESYAADTVPATLSVDGQDEDLVLQRTPAGTYQAEVRAPLAGEHALRLVLKPPLQGTVTAKGALKKDDFFGWLAPLAALLGLLAVAFFAVRYWQDLQQTREGEDRFQRALHERLARLEKEREKIGLAPKKPSPKPPSPKPDDALALERELSKLGAAPATAQAKPPTTPRHLLLSERVASLKKALLQKKEGAPAKEAPPREKAPPLSVPPPFALPPQEKPPAPEAAREGAPPAPDLETELERVKREIAALDRAYKEGTLSVYEYNARLLDIQKRLQALQKR